MGVEQLRLPRRRRRQERALFERLRKLGLCRGDVSIEPISGGLSNHNYAVRTDGRSYFVRVSQDQPLLGIDRRNEVVCHDAASLRGLAPKIIHHERGLLITRFLEGQTLDALALSEPTLLSRLAALLAHLHQSWDVLTGEVLYFCPFQTVRTYARTAARLNAPLPHDIVALLEDVCGLARRIAPFRPVLCHNDLLAANLIDDGEKLWLVDWEYGGAGHPLFDLANASANAAFSDEQDRALLEAYRGCLDARDMAELRIFKAVSLLRESLWSTIQTVASNIDFDYPRYAVDNLEAFRAARAAVD